MLLQAARSFRGCWDKAIVRILTAAGLVGAVDAVDDGVASLVRGHAVRLVEDVAPAGQLAGLAFRWGCGRRKQSLMELTKWRELWRVWGGRGEF